MNLPKLPSLTLSGANGLFTQMFSIRNTCTRKKREVATTRCSEFGPHTQIDSFQCFIKYFIRASVFFCTWGLWSFFGKEMQINCYGAILSKFLVVQGQRPRISALSKWSHLIFKLMPKTPAYVLLERHSNCCTKTYITLVAKTLQEGCRSL